MFRKILINYGEVLPYPICLHRGEEEELVNTPPPVWLNPKATRKEPLDYGTKVFQSSAPDILHIRTENGWVEDVLHALPYRTQFSIRNSHKVYLRRMLLNEDNRNLLPSRASLIRCLVNADEFLSTTSRESFISDDLLENAHREVGAATKEYPRGLVQNSRSVPDKILDIHHFHIRAITSKDNELLRLFMDYLPLETSRGIQSLGSICSVGNIIGYTCNLEGFRQVRRIAGVQGRSVINATCTFDKTLLKGYVRSNQELTLEEISPARLLGQLIEVEGSKGHRVFEAKASELLECFGCICRLKRFTPVDTPVISVVEEREKNNKVANDPLAAVLGSVNVKKHLSSILIFNADNEMVQTLPQIQGDNKLSQRVVCISYVQSSSRGRYPIDGEEVEFFNYSLPKLMATRMNDFTNSLN